MYTTSLKISLG